jgi:hypothetical protein
MGPSAGLSSCPKYVDNSGVAAEELSGLHQHQELAFGECRPQTLDKKLWAVLEGMVCRKRHNSLESLRRSLVKAAADPPGDRACGDSIVAGASQGLRRGIGRHFE